MNEPTAIKFQKPYVTKQQSKASLYDGIDIINMSSEQLQSIISENKVHGKVGASRYLTREQVFDILGSKLTNIEMADKYGVTDSAIIQIRKGRNYTAYYSEFKKIV